MSQYKLKRKTLFLPAILLGFSGKAQAFNPIAVMAATEQIDNALDTSEAALDLMNESAVDPDLIREVDSNVRRLEKLNEKIRETKDVTDSVKDLSEFDLSRERTIAGKLRQVTAKAKQGKRVFAMLGGGKNSGNAAIQVEAVKINYRILDELRNIRLGEFNRDLAERERKVKIQLELENLIKGEQNAAKKKWANYRSSRRGRL